MTTQQRNLLLAIVAVIVAFAAGALWQYASARGYAQNLETTRHELAFQQLEATLGAATIEAQRGSYEIARQLASDFFTRLQTELASSEVERRSAFESILQNRDAMITALSRADAQSGSMLAQLFVRFRLALGEPVGPETDASSATTTTGAP